MVGGGHRLVTLQVWTARISTRDPDALNITRKSGGPDGAPFAPSWKILRPALEARRRAEQVQDPTIELESWLRYEVAFIEEMRASYRTNRPAWDTLLARSRVVLSCYCDVSTDGVLRCHRVLLAEILGKLGADVRGELETPVGTRRAATAIGNPHPQRVVP
jgi:hypothetical protein